MGSTTVTLLQIYWWVWHLKIVNIGQYFTSWQKNFTDYILHHPVYAMCREQMQYKSVIRHTSFGLAWSSLSPWPRRPYRPLPHVYSSPAEVMHALCAPPAAMSITSLPRRLSTTRGRSHPLQHHIDTCSTELFQQWNTYIQYPKWSLPQLFVTIWRFRLRWNLTMHRTNGLSDYRVMV